MIPYEDLVIALQTWRAKQGLPIGQFSGSLTPPMVARTAPPSAPPRAPTPAPAPAAATHDDHLDVEDGALLEEAQYENEGGDFAMAFGGERNDEGDSTMIGGAPRPSEPTLDEDDGSGSGRNHW